MSAEALSPDVFALTHPEGGAARTRAPRASGASLPEGEPLLGTPYVVVRAIGQGGMGEVYEVEHALLGRRCVLKVLHRDHRGRDDLAARMRREARVLAQLEHPSLVDVFDLGVTDDGRPFFAMELLRGRDLREELRQRGPLPVPVALDVIAQALDGLAAAHAAGVVHRDVKLANLFLCDDGAVKLLDFGVAKVPHSDPGPRSHRGVSVGTPRTMAPEQCSFLEVDARTDIYAAGLALYELVAGRGPFDDLLGNAHALRFAHCGRTPPPPSTFAPSPLPPAVEAAILRAIAKAPADRFPSASAMAKELRALSGERRCTRGVPPRPASLDEAPTDVAPPPSCSTPTAVSLLVVPSSARPAVPGSRGGLAVTALLTALVALVIAAGSLGISFERRTASVQGAVWPVACPP